MRYSQMYEANELLPLFQKHTHGRASLHPYAPRVNSDARALDTLDFCPVPADSQNQLQTVIVTQLNLFAGQVYLNSYEEYLGLCSFLGLASESCPEGIVVAPDGFVDPRHRLLHDPLMKATCPFSRSPVAFVRSLITMRRKEQSFTASHVGRILNGTLLGRDYFEPERNASLFLMDIDSNTTTPPPSSPKVSPHDLTLLGITPTFADPRTGNTAQGENELQSGLLRLEQQLRAGILTQMGFNMLSAQLRSQSEHNDTSASL